MTHAIEVSTSSNGFLPVDHWIYLRGLGRDSRHWHGFVELSKSIYPNMQIETIDLPGNGIFADRKSPLKITEYTDWVRHHSQFVAQGKQFGLLALSLGAMVSLDWCYRFPQEVKLATLINTSLAGVSPLKRFSVDAISSFARMALEADTYKRELLGVSLSSNLHPNLREIARHWQNYAKAHKTSGENILRQLFAASRFGMPKAPPSVPLLLMRSLGDRLASPDCSLAISQAWKVPLLSHPSAGHDLALDDGEWVLRRLGAFLSHQQQDKAQ